MLRSDFNLHSGNVRSCKAFSIVWHTHAC